MIRAVFRLPENYKGSEKTALQRTRQGILNPNLKVQCLCLKNDLPPIPSGNMTIGSAHSGAVRIFVSLSIKLLFSKAHNQTAEQSVVIIRQRLVG